MWVQNPAGTPMLRAMTEYITVGAEDRVEARNGVIKLHGPEGFDGMRRAGRLAAEILDALRSANDYCFTTGGIGPTHDDITVDAVAKALGVGVIVHPDARAILERYYADKGGLNDGRLRMARVPEGAELIPNRMSGAPGIRIGNLFLMAGVPHITAGMLDALSGTLEGGRPLVSVIVGAFAPESEVAEILREAEQAVEGISIGSYPFFKEGRVGSNFVIRSEDSEKAKAVAEDLAGKLAEVGYDPVAGGI